MEEVRRKNAARSGDSISDKSLRRKEVVGAGNVLASDG